MDAGELDGSLTTELKLLNRKQLEELAQLLVEAQTEGALSGISPFFCIVKLEIVGLF